MRELMPDLSNAWKKAGNIGNFSDQIVSDIYKNTEEIIQKVERQDYKSRNLDGKIDDILTSRLFGYPIMIALLGFVFWLTIQGANVPSELLATVLLGFQEQLTHWFVLANAPDWLHGILVLGAYRSLAWVVSVMLPPMAIFFPLFTLLEDLGYLPRIAFNLDNTFRKCGACGKQMLTMCMGFGCNAAGVIACRIIDSKRERLIAILTNTFVPCNGRFPTLIALSIIFAAGAAASAYKTIIASAVVTALVMLGIIITFAASWILSKTILRGESSAFFLELPPYRKPQIGAVIYRSIIDRTVFVLKRAMIMAAPAGAVTWVLANVFVGDISVLTHLAQFLEPTARIIGLDGFILMAFILGLPANEIVIPILLMSYLSMGYMVDFTGLEELGRILVQNGWTWVTALNVMLFSLLHWPCSTTLLTAYKESGSLKWTFAAFLIPTVTAFSVCFLTAQLARLLGWT
ncbi:MAG: ferrous iron transporter B [Syntrophomonadaceae bacterium]|nr:ferrous iron transporter B [Syntrophomonadaceae bacterium]